MLARSTKLRHPLGITVETPLLVPSFSSKGFGFNRSGHSEIKKIFDVATEYLTDTMLISAYDLSYGHLDPVESAITELTIIDSGGYEISDIHDMSTVYSQPVRSNEWTEEKLRDVYDKWPKHIPAVFVSFDRPDLRRPLADQIDGAKRLFSSYRQQMHTLLIKPETDVQQYIQEKNVIAAADQLKGFDFLGFTEKELGRSVLRRMENIAAIRLALDDVDVGTPIHIYGSLDPITSLLYFLSGAEVFDGLTWLRFGYVDGFACYQHNYGVKRISIDRPDDFIKGKTIQDNLSYLLDLTGQMKKFLLDRDFGKFDHNSALLRQCYDLLRTKNRRID